MLTLIFTILNACCAFAAVPPEVQLQAHVQQSQTAIRAAHTTGEKLERLDELKNYLNTGAAKLTSSDPVRRRRLRFTVEGLRIYLDYLNKDSTSPAQCATTRNQILYSADPKNSTPAAAPGEARVALDILAAICARN